MTMGRGPEAKDAPRPRSPSASVERHPGGTVSAMDRLGVEPGGDGEGSPVSGAGDGP